jgi:hypothetical protein
MIKFFGLGEYLPRTSKIILVEESQIELCALSESQLSR